jgi:hypothetical protein
MKSLLLAATFACGFAIAGGSGAHAMPAMTMVQAAAPVTGVTHVDYYRHGHHWHHRRWSHGRWHYWN